MTRLAIGAAFSLLVATTSLARAQSEQPTDIGTAARCSRDVNGCTEHPELLDAVKAAADQANVSPTDLLGAVNTTHMDPVAYLCVADGLLCPPPPPATSYAIPGVWAALARCESGGNWHAATGNGYYGGLQEDMHFWQSYGGTAYAPRPDLASPAAQIAVATRGQAVQGWRAWPVCSRTVGLR